MSTRLPARLTVAAFAALTLTSCDSGTRSTASTQPPSAPALVQQPDPSDRRGPPFVQSLNTFTGDVQLIAGQNVAITPDAEARTLTLNVTRPSTAPTVSITRQPGNVIPAGMLNSAIAMSCFPAGSKVVSGGYASATPGLQVYSSHPDVSTAFGERWIVQMANPTAAPISVDVYVVCVS